MTATPHHPSTDRPDPAAAAELLENGLGRRAFVRAALAVGAAAAAGVATAAPASAAPAGRTRLPGEVLQPGTGPIDGEHYLPSVPEQVYWGYLPRVGDPAVLRVRSGSTVTIDTVSHEGILEDQGRDLVAWFGGKGVRAGRCWTTPSPSPASTTGTAGTLTPTARTWSPGRCTSRAPSPATS
ncbi:hypothetical protein [Geodermatophilus obscurus]|uniref:hypothetical protein n=1 Tax=Geodermatophilus obscurus TaxID=1861 RepID=UPI00019B7F02|nr:hypothetical protein [Geodermatophilus obscurus]